MAENTFLDLYRERASKAAAILRYLPFVEMVGLNGSLTGDNATAESDIDFYIVTTPNRLYTARLLTTFAIQLTGKRRYGDKIAGRICLNRYATRAGLTVTPQDEYHARVFSPLVPLFSLPGVYARYRAANQWMPSVGYPVLPPKKLNFLMKRVRSTKPLLRRLIEVILSGKLGDLVEGQLSFLQRKRILRQGATYYSKSRVYIRAEELCLHLAKRP